MNPKEKSCSKCKSMLPDSSFRVRADNGRLTSWCKKCISDNAKGKPRGDSDTYERRRGYWLKQKFKMTTQDWDDMLRSQNNKCFICDKDYVPKAKFSVDHDRSCCDSDITCGNCIRGILCFRCNTGIGHFQDDVRLLNRAIHYLER